jgi:hypothetical protein
VRFRSDKPDEEYDRDEGQEPENYIAADLT